PPLSFPSAPPPACFPQKSHRHVRGEETREKREEKEKRGRKEEGRPCAATTTAYRNTCSPPPGATTPSVPRRPRPVATDAGDRENDDPKLLEGEDDADKPVPSARHAVAAAGSDVHAKAEGEGAVRDTLVADAVLAASATITTPS
ncbi:unnamed protein product, partial [Urochloa humidicola]